MCKTHLSQSGPVAVSLMSRPSCEMVPLPVVQQHPGQLLLPTVIYWGTACIRPASGDSGSATVKVPRSRERHADTGHGYRHIFGVNVQLVLDGAVAILQPRARDGGKGQRARLCAGLRVAHGMVAWVAASSNRRCLSFGKDTEPTGGEGPLDLHGALHPSGLKQDAQHLRQNEDVTIGEDMHHAGWRALLTSRRNCGWISKRDSQHGPPPSFAQWTRPHPDAGL